MQENNHPEDDFEKKPNHYLEEEPKESGNRGSGEQFAYYHETIKNKPRENRGSLKKFVAGLLIISIVGGGSIGVGFALAAPFVKGLTQGGLAIPKEAIDIQKTEGIPELASVQPITTNGTIADIATNVGPSVVSIINNKTVMTWAGEFNQSGLGSGVIFKEDEQKVYMITNAHVVEGASNLVVTFLGNYKAPATIVGMDTITDIAVVAVLKKDIPAEAKSGIRIANLGDSDLLNVGDLAVAIGTPIDEAYNNTVTVGVISALDREINLPDKTLKLIQTDAAINPGNSGGALVGPTGEIVGINTIKLVENQIEGMGFAIPINDVKPIVQELMTEGRIARPSLGIVGESMTESIGFYEIPVGILIREVIPGSSADLAGLQAGDIILEFDRQKITTMEELKQMLRKKKIGDVIPIKIIRGSSKKVIRTKLQDIPISVTKPQ